MKKVLLNIRNTLYSQQSAVTCWCTSLMRRSCLGAMFHDILCDLDILSDRRRWRHRIRCTECWLLETVSVLSPGFPWPREMAFHLTSRMGSQKCFFLYAFMNSEVPLKPLQQCNVANFISTLHLERSYRPWLPLKIAFINYKPNQLPPEQIQVCP